MSPSLRFLAERMDPMFPPVPEPFPSTAPDRISMRALASRFRYIGVIPGQTPAVDISLRDLWGRAGEEVQTLSFLSYNTYLLRDMVTAADVVKIAGGLPRFIFCLRLSVFDIAVEALKRLNPGHDFCDRWFPPVASVCGVSVNPLNTLCKAGSDVAQVALEAASDAIAEVGEDIDAIFDHLGIPIDLMMEAVFAVLGDSLPQIKEITKPDIPARIKQIAAEVSRYDVAAMCEVWQPDDRQALLSSMTVPPVAAFSGPPAPTPGELDHLGSGLLVVSTSRPMIDGGTHTYDVTGVSRPMPGGCDFGHGVDADKWARKGVQFSLVDVGLGFLEIYSTHLYSGGDMDIWDALFGGSVTEDEKATIRAAQAAQLVEFVADRHDPRNVAIITGDFNMGDAQRPALLSIMGEFVDRSGETLVFDDWFAMPMFAAPRGVVLPPAGHTNRGGSTPTFASHCKVPPVGAPFPPLVGDFFCDDSVPMDPDPTGQRIDYLFVQRPSPSHSFRLDLSRMRRRAFQRQFHPANSELFMSDHLGLEVTMFISS